MGVCGCEGGEVAWDEGVDCCFREIVFGRHLELLNQFLLQRATGSV